MNSHPAWGQVNVEETRIKAIDLIGRLLLVPGRVPSAFVALTIHIIALTIHIVALTIHIVALTIHTVALTIHIVALTIHIVALTDCKLVASYHLCRRLSRGGMLPHVCDPPAPYTLEEVTGFALVDQMDRKVSFENI
eukprot:7844308-Pyramimonas_sp.AAC.1